VPTKPKQNYIIFYLGRPANPIMHFLTKAHLLSMTGLKIYFINLL